MNASNRHLFSNLVLVLQLSAMVSTVALRVLDTNACKAWECFGREMTVVAS